MENEVKQLLKIKGYKFIISETANINFPIAVEFNGVELPEVKLDTISEYIRAIADEIAKIDIKDNLFYTVPMSILMLGTPADRDYLAEKIGFDAYGKFIFYTILMSGDLYTSRYKEDKQLPESFTLLTKSTVLDVARVGEQTKDYLLADSKNHKEDSDIYIQNLQCCTKIKNATEDFIKFYITNTTDGINLIPVSMEIVEAE